MVGSALVGTGDRVDNDNNKKVGVLGAYNLPIVERTLETVTDTVYPGMLCMHPTGAGGEDKLQLCDDKDTRGIAFAEVDFAQLSNCTGGYTAADEIPCIFLPFNNGAILRNVHLVNPAANINATASLTSSSGTQGKLKEITEATFETGSSTGGYQWQVNTLGTNAAAGTFILPRIYAKLAYYAADGSADFTDVVYAVWT